jgi:glycerol-3-phosphate dehydrogenase subunit B
VTVDLPDMDARHNLNGLVLARNFDDPKWRAAAIARIVAALEAAGAGSGGAGSGGGLGRVGLPAVLGLDDHAAAFEELRRRSPVEPFEMPLVPPSVPGMRLYYALRAALIAAGGRIKVGEWIANVDRDGPRVTGVATEAAVRAVSVRTGALILATGGLSGGGIAADLDGTLREIVLGLPVDAPDRDDWFGHDAFDPNGHPLERAGIRTDSDLRPLGPGGEPVFENVRVVGTLLAGQRHLRERCRDGVDFTSGWRAARLLSGASGASGAPGPAVAEVRRP